MKLSDIETTAQEAANQQAMLSIEYFCNDLLSCYEEFGLATTQQAIEQNTWLGPDLNVREGLSVRVSELQSNPEAAREHIVGFLAEHVDLLGCYQEFLFQARSSLVRNNAIEIDQDKATLLEY